MTLSQYAEKKVEKAMRYKQVYEECNLKTNAYVARNS